MRSPHLVRSPALDWRSHGHSGHTGFERNGVSVYPTVFSRAPTRTVTFRPADPLPVLPGWLGMRAADEPALTEDLSE
jgi:hypothetical protein